MKVIDLLNKIANGEDELPYKIQYHDDIYSYAGNDTYLCIETNKILSDEIYVNYYDLNYEFDIIEDKKIEKSNLDKDELRGKEIPRAIDYLLESKINEIIDYINKEK